MLWEESLSVPLYNRFYHRCCRFRNIHSYLVCSLPDGSKSPLRKRIRYSTEHSMWPMYINSHFCFLLNGTFTFQMIRKLLSISYNPILPLSIFVLTTMAEMIRAPTTASGSRLTSIVYSNCFSRRSLLEEFIGGGIVVIAFVYDCPPYFFQSWLFRLSGGPG